jgi:hypothetical protein
MAGKHTVSVDYRVHGLRADSEDRCKRWMTKNHWFNIRVGLLHDGRDMMMHPWSRGTWTRKSRRDLMDEPQIFAFAYDALVDIVRHLVVVDVLGDTVVLDLDKAYIAMYDGINYAVPAVVEYYNDQDHAVFVLAMRRANGEFE